MSSQDDVSRYADMLDLPHHTSQRHPPMSRRQRAAQFMPFAALTGYDAIIAQTAQQVEQAVEQANTPSTDIIDGA